MKSYAIKLRPLFVLAFSALSFFANAQNAEKLKPFAHKLLYVDKANIYSGVDLAKDGEKYSTLTIPELITGFDATWSDPNPRKSLLDKENGLSHNRNTPIFKKPVGDIPHIYFPNVLGSQFISKRFPVINSPNTTFALVRIRDAVKWEGGIGMGASMRERGDHWEIGNFSGVVQLDKGLLPLNRWIFIVMEDNGPLSRVMVNGVQIGDFKTLPKSYIDALYYGTNSHVIEHDLKFCAVYNGIFTESQLAELMQVVNKIVPIGSFPRKPVIYEPKIKFENGVFKVASYKYHGYDETPINPASIKYEWIVIDGETGLDGQRLAGTGAELNIPKRPGQQVAVIVTCKDMKGRYYPGIPFRSEFCRDER
jgi:hypothetical protein